MDHTVVVIWRSIATGGRKYRGSQLSWNDYDRIIQVELNYFNNDQAVVVIWRWKQKQNGSCDMAHGRIEQVYWFTVPLASICIS